MLIYATLSPIDARPELTSDETALVTYIERFGAYALLGLLFYLAYPRHVVLVYLLVLRSAVVLETLQIFVPERDARVFDALEKISGGIAGILAATAILAFGRHGAGRHRGAPSAYPMSLPPRKVSRDEAYASERAFACRHAIAPRYSTLSGHHRRPR
jgi:hypothetical protein